MAASAPARRNGPLEPSDMVGVATWKAILQAVGELRRERREDERLN